MNSPCERKDDIQLIKETVEKIHGHLLANSVDIATLKAAVKSDNKKTSSIWGTLAAFLVSIGFEIAKKIGS